MITTVNFHLVKACNFKCKFCYATFNDIISKALSKSQQFKTIRLLAESHKFRKINFAGGEPTLVPYIDELIKYAKELGFETSIVTNASRIDSDWIEKISPYLDILAISIDSVDNQVNLMSGRSEKGKLITTKHFVNIAKTCKKYGIALKINTVVNQFNKGETLTDFINIMKPFRWKLLQVTRVEGQNEFEFDSVKISSSDFIEYCRRNENNIDSSIKIVTESCELIQGSYLMIDQLGRFYDSNNQKHNYSDKILEVGVSRAYSQINPDYQKFLNREGSYSTSNLTQSCTS